MKSGQAFAYRCQACSQGEIIFWEWAIIDDEEHSQPPGYDFLGMVLGCTTCVQKYLCIPKPNEMMAFLS